MYSTQEGSLVCTLYCCVQCVKHYWQDHLSIQVTHLNSFVIKLTQRRGVWSPCLIVYITAVRPLRGMFTVSVVVNPAMVKSSCSVLVVNLSCSSGFSITSYN